MFKRLFIVLSIIFASLYFVSFFIDESIYIERSYTVEKASSEDIFNKIVDIKAWSEWNFFSSEQNSKKFSIKYTYDSLGRAITMQSKDGEENEILIRFDEVLPNKKVVALFLYTVNGKKVQHSSTYYLAPDAEDLQKTSVRWIYEGQFSPAPFASPLKFFLLISRYLLGKQMEKSLKKLQKILLPTKK